MDRNGGPAAKVASVTRTAQVATHGQVPGAIKVMKGILLALAFWGALGILQGILDFRDPAVPWISPVGGVVLLLTVLAFAVFGVALASMAVLLFAGEDRCREEMSQALRRFDRREDSRRNR